MVDNLPRLEAKGKFVQYGRVRRYHKGRQTKYDFTIHLVWIPKYLKKILIGAVALRVRDLIQEIAMEHDIQILSGKVGRDHIHLFLSYHPEQSISKVVQ